MPIGTLAEWFAASFAGLTAFLIWRQTRRLPPTVELEASGIFDGKWQLSLQVRNNDPRHSIMVGEVWAQPREAWRLDGYTHGGAEVRVAVAEIARIGYFLRRSDGGDPKPPLPDIWCAIRSRGRTKNHPARLV